MPTDHYRQAESFMVQASRHTDTGVARDEELAVLFNQRALIQATLAVADQLRELRAEYAADKCPKCFYRLADIELGDQQSCDNCGWSA